MTQTILVIDDQQALLSPMEKMLVMEGFEVVTAQSPEDGLAKIATRRFDLVITDIDMPQMDGLEVIMRLRMLHPRTPVIAMSGVMLGDDFIKLEMDLGASAALRKPFRREQLIAAVNRVLAQKTDVARPTSFPEG